MTEILTRLKDFIERNDLIKPREKLILGISGGPDSIFLLHLLIELKKTYKNFLLVAHFNHLLRPEAGDDEEFVREFCREHNLQFVCERKEVRKYYKGDSLEQTARHLRFDFFLKASRKYKIKKIVLAHHRDDLIETIIMRLMRGSGLLGLRGMLPSSKYKKIILLRPLLFITKAEILTYLKQHSLSFVVDQTNNNEVFLRNKVRATLIPQIRKIAPSFEDNLFNLSKTITWDYDYIYGQCQKIFQKALLKRESYCLELSIERISGIHRSLLNNLIRVAIEEIKGGLRKIESRHIEEVCDLLTGRPIGSVVDIPGVKVIKKKGSLVFKNVC